jgi:hypothetical protein
MYWHSKINLKLLLCYKVSRVHVVTLTKKFISCNPFSIEKEGRIYSIVKMIYHKIIKYTIISLGERDRKRERLSHNDSLWETSWLRRNRWEISLWHNRQSLLACCDIKMRLKKELSFGHYETISKPLGSKSLNINFFFLQKKITHLVLIE